MFFKFSGKAITAYNICELVNYAFGKSANMLTAQNGFRATGIHPFDPSIFTDCDFSAADFLIRTSTKDESQGPQESLNAQVNDIQVSHVINAVDSNLDIVNDTITIDQIDADEFYVIRSNGDIIIGPLSNQYSLITNPHEEDQRVNHSFDTADVIGDVTLEPTPPERSMIIDGQQDEEALVDSGIVLDPTGSMEAQENVPPAQLDTNPKKRKRNDARGSLPLSDPDANNHQPKKRRWDQNDNNPLPKQDCFTISPSSVARKLEKKPIENRRKKSAMRKEHATELTASPHRKKLIETTALKDIKNIQKTGRKRTGRKVKTPVTDAMDDILCSICGSTFSTSANGKGWSKCTLCQEWFHTICSTDIRNCSTCN